MARDSDEQNGPTRTPLALLIRSSGEDRSASVQLVRLQLTVQFGVRWKSWRESLITEGEREESRPGFLRWLPKLPRIFFGYLHLFLFCDGCGFGISVALYGYMTERMVDFVA